jgi:hypothetical protein
MIPWHFEQFFVFLSQFYFSLLAALLFVVTFPHEIPLLPCEFYCLFSKFWIVLHCFLCLYGLLYYYDPGMLTIYWQITSRITSGPLLVRASDVQLRWQKNSIYLHSPSIISILFIHLYALSRKRTLLSHTLAIPENHKLHDTKQSSHPRND